VAAISYKRDIFPIAMPIFLGSLVFQAQTLINRAFLGHLGANNLSVISNVVFPMWTTMAMLGSLTTGATIIMSQRLGAKDRESARSTGAAALKWSSLFSLLLFAFWFFCSEGVYRLMGVSGEILADCVAYTRISAFSFFGVGLSNAICAIFQASGKTKPMMYSGALRSGLNILLDWLLIFGSLGFPEMGLLGAALATVLSDACGLTLLVVLLVKDRGLAARPSLRAALASPFSAYWPVVRMGVPTSLEDLLWNLGNVTLISFLNALDPLAVAAYSLIFTIEILPIVAFSALGQTTTVLTGRAKGAGDIGRARQAALKAQAAAWIASAAVAAAFLFFPAGIVGVFTTDAELRARAIPILLVSSFTLFPRSVNFMAGSGIRGMGDTKWMLATQVAGTIFIVVLGRTLIFAPGLGVIGLFIAMLADEGLRSGANGGRFFLLLRRERRAAAGPVAAAAVDPAASA
jgi:multidrug resistance protein, MATE family